VPPEDVLLSGYGAIDLAPHFKAMM
jgi:hypothetical protein